MYQSPRVCRPFMLCNVNYGYLPEVDMVLKLYSFPM